MSEETYKNPEVIRSEPATIEGDPFQKDLFYDTLASRNTKIVEYKDIRGQLDVASFQAVVFDFTTNVATGDGKFYMHIEKRLNGMKLVYVHARVITAGTTNTTDIQIANVTQGTDMLSTKLTIDSAETGSNTAATAAVINPANNRILENDVIRIDVDAISTTAPKGLIVTLGFQLI